MVQTNNTTLVNYLNHQWSTKSSAALSEASLTLWWAELNSPTLLAVNGWDVDFLHWETFDPGEWSVLLTIFLQICRRWGFLDIDPFYILSQSQASRIRIQSSQLQNSCGACDRHSFWGIRSSLLFVPSFFLVS